MIVTNYNQKIQLFKQYDHSKVSGSFVPYWRNDEVQLAITEHDRAWIPLDQKPIWNEDKDQPHSFMDYPSKPKLEAYSNGIDEVENQSAYAGYLNRKHFLSFFDKNSTDRDISRFISREMERQKQLKQAFSKSLTEEIIDFHFNLLQFCDDLSLYLCLNEPGTMKENEIFMFKDGFRQRFEGLDGQMRAEWINKEQMRLDPFPFKEPFMVEIPFKEIIYSEVKEKGLRKSYQNAETSLRKVLISKQDE
ncbi:DUF3891 family protein [Tenuibacillus multivorans]|uniref:DUF3891 domain-containing protein n=1 Tax=Tenuibacillus multivorans TaxID=237069 RepID=A0A1G9W2N2_9BACI|nr:DUF3891 family protein [Tenuibacillus multivorans]GEL78290.1 serine hydroxymethyltransferase [Tenuibacillus multivorans]SDM78774.1 Protein of unknown function [Tenuibacillus multivorans]